MSANSNSKRLDDFAEVVHNDLDRLAALPPNWDAQGAQPIDAAVLNAARWLTANLPENLIKPPSVVPMAKGNLQFEWRTGPRSLELEIETPETIHYLKWHPAEGVEDEARYAIADLERTVDLLRWFTDE